MSTHHDVETTHIAERRVRVGGDASSIDLVFTMTASLHTDMLSDLP
jgi:hypothetical protein